MKFHTTRFVTDDVPPGKYTAIFSGCSAPVAMQFGEAIFWGFEVMVKGESLMVNGVTSTSFALDPRCKARRWAEALDPTFTPAVDTWDSESVVGEKCIIDVVYFDGSEGLRSTVKEVYKWESQQSEQKSDAS